MPDESDNTHVRELRRLLDLLSAPMFDDREMERELASTLPLGVVWRRVMSE
ncbi:MAG: hypothetical protein LBP58_06340 [Azoarcus sp.]|jgi:hypothetical protein|nr:hypothetical protein [Azoarcus sp.]